jgi:hypothetical protein
MLSKDMLSEVSQRFFSSDLSIANYMYININRDARTKENFNQLSLKALSEGGGSLYLKQF